MMSLQSWWFPETDWDDYKNTRVTQVERCYAGWNKSWVVGIGHGMQQVSQSKKQISPRTILFLGENLFWGAKKRGSTGEVDICCSPQPPEALDDPDV